MRIPMIFFTITIERKQKTAEEVYNEYLLQQRLLEIEAKRVKMESDFPAYCTRL